MSNYVLINSAFRTMSQSCNSRCRLAPQICQHFSMDAGRTNLLPPNQALRKDLRWPFRATYGIGTQQLTYNDLSASWRASVFPLQYIYVNTGQRLSGYDPTHHRVPEDSRYQLSRLLVHAVMLLNRILADPTRPTARCELLAQHTTMYLD